MKIALVLGSGGARGNAHIGVIRELEARGHEIVSVAGTSMGALIGGIYSSGGMDKYLEIAEKLTRTEEARLADFSMRGPGLALAHKLVDKLATITGDVNIEDLDLPFTAVATDLLNRREVWLREGSLLAAMRASISIPVAFTPMVINNQLLVDGGLLNPLPTDAVNARKTDVTVAVSLLSQPRHLHRFKASEVASAKASHLDEANEDATDPFMTDEATESSSENKRFAELRKLGSRLWRRNGDDDAEPAPVLPNEAPAGSARYGEPLPKGLTMVDMGTMALDSMQASIETYRTAMCPPDVLVKIPFDTCSVFDFTSIDRMIEFGRETARKEFDFMGL